MADTLAEIYRNTLTESDFNSSGEATIVTTDSSTSHVVKGVQVVEGNSKIPVAGNIDVNGFNVVALTGNSSGTEIIAPSSTVKVKASGFPLVYDDTSFLVHDGASTYGSFSEAKLNTVIQDDFFTATSQAIGYNLSTVSGYGEDRRLFVPNLGPNNYQLLVFEAATRNTFTIYVKNSSGTNQFTGGGALNTGWWDGSRYFYFTNKDNYYINKLDTWTATNNSTFHSFGSTTSGTYARMVGVKDKFLFFWLISGSGGTKFYNFTTGTGGTFTTQDANQTFANTDKEFYCVQRTDGTFVMMVVDAADNIKWWKFTESDLGGTNVGGGSTGYTDLTPSGNSELFRSYTRMHSAVGTKLFYINNEERLASWDFATDTPVHKVEYDPGSAITIYADPHLSYHINTPSSATIAARDYGTAPSLGLRITGVTST
jgi:hypothetical protein